MNRSWAALVKNDATIRTIDISRLQDYDEFDPDTGESLLDSLLELYLRNSPALLDQLRTAVQAGDLPHIHDLAHTLKPSSASLGASRLSRLYLDLELKSEPNASTPQSVFEYDLAIVVEEFKNVQRELTLIYNIRNIKPDRIPP